MTAQSVTDLVAEPERLRALDELRLLDTPAEEGFDDIAEIARQSCHAPIALISLVAANRQWFKAHPGFAHGETGLDQSVCVHVLDSVDLLVIPDLTQDARTAGNPLVTGDPAIRFYAGAPLRTPEGRTVGSLCVIDTKPRPSGLNGGEATTLRALARQVVSLLALRRAVQHRDAVLERQRRETLLREALMETQAAIFSAGGDLDLILDTLIDGAMKAIPAVESGVIEFIEGDEFVYRSARGGVAPQVGMRIPVRGSLSGVSLSSNQPLLCDDVLADPRRNISIGDRVSMRSAMFVPVFRGGRAIAVLVLYAATPGLLTAEDLEVARLFAGTVAAGLAEAGEVSARRQVALSERRHRDIFESAIDYAIVVLDLAGRVTDWNEGARRVLGWTAEEACGRHADFFFTPQDREAEIPQAEMRAALEQGRGADERWHIRKDGARFWANGEMMALRDETGVAIGYIKILRDRTEAREATAKLQDSEERYRQLVDLSPAIIWFGQKGGTLSYLSHRYYEHTGLSPATTPPERWADALHPDDAARVFTDWQAARDSEGVYDTEFRLRGRDGNYRWFSSRAMPVRDREGRITGWLGNNSDIQERKTAQEEAGKLAAIVQQSTDFIGIARPDGRVDFVNEAGRRLVGLSDEAAARRTNIMEFFAAADRQAVLDSVLPAVKRDNFWQGELQFRHFATGADVPVLYNIFPLRDAVNGLFGYATVTRDLTEQKRVDAALQEQQRSLRAVLDAIPVGVLFAEAPSGRVIGGNRRIEEILRHAVLPTADAESYGEWVAFHVDGSKVEPLEYPLARIIREKLDHAELECEYQRGDGSRLWISITGAPMRDSEGAIVGAVVAIADIDARKRADDMQRLMNHELSHRLKNLLAVVQAITRQSFRSATDLEALSETLSNRLVVLGNAHDVLLGGVAEQAPIASIIRSGTGVLGEAADEQIVLDGPELEVGSKAALSLGLMIHELSTNATKYGALSTPAGRVRVSWSVAPNEARPQFKLDWLESGGPPVQVPTRRGFGSRLIERGVSGLVGGSVQVEYRPEGLVCSVQAPLAELSAA